MSAGSLGRMVARTGATTWLRNESSELAEGRSASLKTAELLPAFFVIVQSAPQAPPVKRKKRVQPTSSSKT